MRKGRGRQEEGRSARIWSVGTVLAPDGWSGGGRGVTCGEGTRKRGLLRNEPERKILRVKAYAFFRIFAYAHR